MKALDAIVATHQEWGDRKNRNWARMKYVVYKMGIPWFREQVKARGAQLELPQEDLDYGSRRLHQGWNRQETDGKYCYGDDNRRRRRREPDVHGEAPHRELPQRPALRDPEPRPPLRRARGVRQPVGRVARGDVNLMVF